MTSLPTALGSTQRIVGLSGSLRTDSSNAALVRAAFVLLPVGIETVLCEDVGSLPHFNPDIDQEGSVPPPAVAGFRALLRSADGFIVSVPEYAHGLPGAFKNAIDWVVSSGELGHKPVLVLNASAGGNHAQANLVETLTVIEARVLGASLLTPFLGHRITRDASLGDTDRATLQRSVTALLLAIDEMRSA
jgi:NAD(P)H-dependent FMN reductase